MDKHHIIHSRIDWAARPQAKTIRENRWLIPPLPKEVHEDLHRAVPPVPLLGYHALTYVNKHFEPFPRDYIASMKELMDVIHDHSQRENVHELERRLADIAIETIDMQIPFVREGVNHLEAVA